MTRQDKDDWQKRQDLEAEGYEIHIQPAVHLHGPNETPKHAHVKLALAREILKRGRRFDTEVKGPGGRVDVLDLGAPDEQPLVYEVETDSSAKQRKEKAKQYAVGPVRDVIVLDPTEAPDQIEALSEWAERQVVG